MPQYTETVQQLLSTPAQTLYLLLAMIVAIVVGIIMWWGGKSLLNFGSVYLAQQKAQAENDRANIEINRGLLHALTDSVNASKEFAKELKSSNERNKELFDSNRVKLIDIQTMVKAHEDATPSRVHEVIEGTRAIVTDATQPLSTMLKGFDVVLRAMQTSIDIQTEKSNINASEVKALLGEVQKSIKAIIDYAPPPEKVEIIKSVTLDPLPHDEMESKP